MRIAECELPFPGNGIGPAEPGVVRATVAKPELLLADEPTGNLHSDQAKEIMDLFCKLNASGTTIVQVTHSETNADYGQRIIRLKDGWLEPHSRERPDRLRF
jgi:ABC-type lipoprotein export system ATPase subunit